MNNPAIHTKDEFTLEEKVKYSILGTIVLGAAFFIGRTIVRKTRKNIEANKSYKEGSPADHAQRLKIAIEGAGTDEEAIRRVLRVIKSKDEFKKVMQSYNADGSNLMIDLKDDLSVSEYNEMLAIIGAKPDHTNSQAGISLLQYQSWARRLKAAFEYTYWGGMPGTDNGAIRAVFLEIPNQAAFQQVAAAYRQEYGSDLLSDLNSELEFWERGEILSLIDKKPK